MRDRYNLNLLPGMSEDGVEYGECVCVYVYVCLCLREIGAEMFSLNVFGVFLPVL